MSPFDELTALRSVLSWQEIAEVTGMRRETLSRARRDSRFQRRTQKALDDLYAVVIRLRPAVDDQHHLMAVLRRPQEDFGRRSIAELLQDGKVEEVLEHLPAPQKPKAEPAATPRAGASPDDSVDAFLAADPELVALLPEIEANARKHFAPVEWIKRHLIVEPGADDVLYLEVRNDRSFDENFKRLMAMLEQERDLLRPVRARLTIGFL